MLDLIHAYETYLTKVKQASANTVCSYMRDIRQFTEWLQESEHTDILDATQLNISDYLSHQRVEGKSGATISRTLASLKNFYAYVISTGFLEESPVSGEIHVDRGEKKLPQILTGKEVELLLAQPSGVDAKGLRDKAMKPAGWADTKTWGKLWNAVKLEVQETTNLKPGSEAFLEESGKRFSDIIDRTQVVDSVLHRSQVMRSKNFANKVVTSFMSEPTKSYNMLRSAARNVQKNGWKSGGGRLARAAVTHTVTSIVTALAAALVDAARDDDKDKDWLQKFLSASGENILDNLNPLNMLPYAKELVSLLSGYSLTRQEMAGLVDVVNAGKNWATYFSGDSKYSIPWLIKNSAASISKLTGIPLASVTRDLEGMVRGAVQIASDSGLPTTGLEYTLDTFYYPVIPKNASRYAEYVYDAYKEKNPKLAQDILTAMEKGGISEDKITYSMRKVLRESDSRIAEAARAKMDGNMSSYAKIVGELRNEGFDREWVLGAVDGWISNVKNAAKKKGEGKQKEYKESVKELEEGGVDREWLENTVDRLIGQRCAL